MAENNDEIHLDADRARAGTTPHIVRYVLGVSLLLIVVIYAIILLV